MSPSSAEHMRSDVWSALDQVLTQSGSGWEKLRSFTLHVVVLGYNAKTQTTYINNLVQELQELLVFQLKGLVSNDDIAFDLDISSAFRGPTYY